MATNEKTKNVSYRRRRDYTASFTWTYELNQDVYQCYTKARENPAIGYMKRMKAYWDEMHPELNHLSEKHLRQQATFAEKRFKGQSNTENDATVRGEETEQETPRRDQRERNGSCFGRTCGNERKYKR